jgi:hypothetical protein
VVEGEGAGNVCLSLRKKSHFSQKGLAILQKNGYNVGKPFSKGDTYGAFAVKISLHRRAV